jgi:preprotein translocase subunit SecB
MADADKAAEVQFQLERIYTKDISYESPAVPHVFLEQAAPQLDIHIGVQHSTVHAEQGLHEVVLVVSVAAKHAEKNIFLVEVQQAGLFRIAGIAGEELQRALEVSGAYVLLPFVREVVSDLVGKGGFPQLLINPINFEALYDQKQAMLQKSTN